MKLNTKFLTFLLLACFSLSIIFSCSKNENEMDIIEPDPIIEQVNGSILNKIDGSPISGITVELFEVDWGGERTEYVQSQVSDLMGKFEFTSFPLERSFYGRRMSLKHSYQDHHQKAVWVNGEIDISYGGYTDLALNTVAPQQLTYELYPITMFKLNVINVDPVMDSDTIKIDIVNSEWPYEFEFTGINVDEIIERSTKLENVITINYEVITDSLTQEFSKIIECSPGDTTEVLIEY